MISLSHPVVERLVADSAWPPLADWLTDQGATAGDLALLYAGTPPAHADGISRECLALWLECQGSREQAEAVRVQRLDALAAADEVNRRIYPLFPLGITRESFLVMDRDIEQALTSNVKPDPAIAAVIAAVIAEFQRLLRRRVLSLPWAAGVRVTRACCFYFHRDSDVERAAALRRAAHFLSPEVSCRYQVRDDPTDPRRAIWSVLQTPTAPELIWPEPEAKADNERRYRRVSSQLYEQPPAYE